MANETKSGGFLSGMLKWTLAVLPAAFLSLALLAAWKKWAPETWKAKIPL